MEQNGERLKVAVVGAGISGIVAAQILSRAHDVSLFERNDRLGGHTNTREVLDGTGAALAVDTGFIVCNPTNYPNFYRFLSQLNVALRDSDMSFGFSCEETGLAYLGPALREILQAPGNLLNPRFLKMLFDRMRFNRRILADLRGGLLDTVSLHEYLTKVGASEYLVRNYLTPLIAAIWSSPDGDALKFPTKTFAVFFDNHGMLELYKRPRWQTVVGGSHQYLQAFAKQFRGTIRTGVRIAAIRRDRRDVEFSFADGNAVERFDRVVLATHADEALALLADPDDEERALLGAWRYNRNRTVLHTDGSVLPPSRRLWASWNYRLRRNAPKESPVAVTYYMNRLQGLKSKSDFLVTLNPDAPIDPAKVLYETEYTHPCYTTESVAAQPAILKRNGLRHTYYCGAYLGYGFHEDGVKSALAVTDRFGMEL